jgi:hypothetical protein
MGLFKRSSKKEAHIIIDIGSGSVAASAVLISLGGKSEILFSTRSHFDTQIDNPSATRLVGFLKQSVREVLFDLSNEGVGKLQAKGITFSSEDIECTLSSPWVSSVIRHISFSKDEPVELDEELLLDAIKREIDIEEKQAQMGQLTLIEKELTDIKLNGYSLEYPFGKEARDFEFDVLMNLVPTLVTELVGGAVDEFFPGREINFHSFQFVSSQVVKQLFPQHESYLLCDVTAEVVDLTFVDKGAIVSHTTLPIGQAVLLRRVARKLQVSVEIAESLMSLYVNNKADEILVGKMKQLLSQNLDEWTLYFKDVFRALKTTPNIVFLTSDDEMD